MAWLTEKSSGSSNLPMQSLWWSIPAAVASLSACTLFEL